MLENRMKDRLRRALLIGAATIGGAMVAYGLKSSHVAAGWAIGGVGIIAWVTYSWK